MSSSEVTDTPSSSVIDLDFSPPPTARTEQEKMLDYREYRGFLMCFGCGKEVAEHEIVPLDGRHVFCSDKCLRYTIGI